MPRTNTTSTTLPVPPQPRPRPTHKRFPSLPFLLRNQRLHPAHAPISQSHLDAARMVAAREQSGDDAVDAVARWLVCF
ncbi:predicted protein [Plenodomus lingam JN3]|uniref:Predicted protein n=1 Tax=Leptosphaeria maculans (strain JN3 / isolate v23.1.3 / race Av1-4-5-6-7-8) TaxID=985895 RepID=E5AA69_LEPMJ|nr:predicted protein [Plenodomus lingam JN3]CBY00560.1 predicted protein [Plenodomus lingam JN3]